MADVPAVPHDGDPVAEIKDLVEAVRDEEDAGSLVPEAAGDGEQPLHFDTAQGGRRLIHHEHFGVERNGLGDFDDLLVRNGESLGNARRIDGDTEALEELAGLPDHGCLADQAEPALGLASDEDVLRDAEVRKQRGFLVDDGDSGGLAVADVAELNALPADPEVARIRMVQACEDLDQSGLSGAVLADQCVDFSGSDFDGAVGQRDHRAEGLGRVGKGEYRAGSVRRGTGPGTVCLLHRINRTFGAE